jgi:enamine deaminase RidA (YjgF/YER057c/UK114 family)
VLEAAGATIKDLVKVTIILHNDADLRAGFAEWMKVWGKNTKPPTVTSLRVPVSRTPIS